MPKPPRSPQAPIAPNPNPETPMADDRTVRSRPLARSGIALALLCAALGGAVVGRTILPEATAQTQPQPAPPVPAAPAGSAAESEFGTAGGVARQQIGDVLRRTTQALAAPLGDDVDRDLAERIVAFHQSSIDLAQIVLQLGADPELRRLAVISLQAESQAVADIRTWLNNRELVRNQVEPPPIPTRRPGELR